MQVVGDAEVDQIDVVALEERIAFQGPLDLKSGSKLLCTFQGTGRNRGQANVDTVNPAPAARARSGEETRADQADA
jgi:hypothetical protein